MNKKIVIPAVTISSVVILVALISLYFFTRRLSGLETTVKQQKSIIAQKNAEIEYRLNKNKELIADKLSVELTNKQLIESYPKLAEQIQRDFDIKIKNLKAYMQAEFSASGEGSSTINNHYYTDSSGVKRRYWKLKASDGYLDFLATVYDSTNAPYEYKYSDKVEFAIHAKKKWILGNEKLYGSAKLSNPNAVVTGSESMLINDFRDKRWSVGPFVGAGVVGGDVKIVFGVGVQYGLFKF